MIGKPGYTFKFGSKRKIPQKSPESANRNRQSIIDGNREDLDSDKAALEARYELSAIDTQISTLTNQKDTLRNDLRTQFQEKYVAGRDDLDSHIKALQTSREKIQTGGAFDKGYEHCRLTLGLENDFKEELAELQREAELRAPSPPYVPPSSDAVNKIISKRVIFSALARSLRT